MNAAFIHIPRTAGRFVMAALGLERLIYRRRAKVMFRQEGLVTFGHQSYPGLIECGVVGREFDKTAFKFAFCRNPFDRVVSHFFYARIRQPQILPRNVSFAEFVGRIEDFNVPIRAGKKTFRPQRQSVDGVKLDFIGRYESLVEDLKTVSRILGVALKSIGRIGKTHHRPYWTYYDHQTERKVRDFYREDFEFFGYDNHILYRS